MLESLSGTVCRTLTSFLKSVVAGIHDAMKADQSSMKYLGLGVELGIVMTLPVYLELADAKWDCTPYGLSFGLLVGIGGLIKSVRRVMRDY